MTKKLAKLIDAVVAHPNAHIEIRTLNGAKKLEVYYYDEKKLKYLSQGDDEYWSQILDFTEENICKAIELMKEVNAKCR